MRQIAEEKEKIEFKATDRGNRGSCSSFFLPWANLFLPWVICFRREWFTFAVSDLLLPWQLWATVNLARSELFFERDIQFIHRPNPWLHNYFTLFFSSPKKVCLPIKKCPLPNTITRHVSPTKITTGAFAINHPTVLYLHLHGSVKVREHHTNYVCLKHSS